MGRREARKGVRVVLDCRGLTTPRALAKVRAAFRMLRGRNAIAQLMADQPTFGEDLTLWCGILGLHVVESHAKDDYQSFTVVEQATGLLIRDLGVVDGFWPDVMPRAAHLDARQRHRSGLARPETATQLPSLHRAAS